MHTHTFTHTVDCTVSRVKLLKSQHERERLTSGISHPFVNHGEAKRNVFSAVSPAPYPPCYQPSNVPSLSCLFLSLPVNFSSSFPILLIHSTLCRCSLKGAVYSRWNQSAIHSFGFHCVCVCALAFILSKAKSMVQKWRVAPQVSYTSLRQFYIM